MLRNSILALTLALSLFSCQQQPQQTTATTQTSASDATTAQATASEFYYPEEGDNWERRNPEELGLDPAKLQAAVEWAKTQETQQIEKDFSTQAEIFGRPLGPLPATRANTNGIILKDGYIVAEWGDTKAVDPTYSVAKSFLSTILGLTLDKGMIQSINDPVARYVNDGGYASAQNSKVTWEHHARQTSEWQGELWGKKDDFVGKEEYGRGERKPRELQEPGTFYEYNDTRINRFALSLLRVWEKPLPEVLEDEIMDPIDASETWRWVPYQNSIATVNGKQMPSVSGGTRWGGGLWISARDEARFGYLFLRNGRWEDKQLISEEWVKQATTARGPVGPDYGYLWWLNTSGEAWPDAPKTSYAALGAGQNTVWVDPEHDIVIVWRWHNGNQNELFKRVLEAVK
ncbi:serine hydrolase domain-containing protein [Pontibacter akesuensis]|uniref:CubicO group peptidase, beta-lactamase class C family n=1 Tax=Pontibacter akesuensis TaxID=388950 RepID=A0A1I7J142_9BACT|nr:serine hydrolase [Pontibacter akesuensis]GHA73063.1 serine hydrolase [Pontibacter akesuensis]SFU78925.1 CubicO group peptidase, beta-lactamase class C family [Pontibacter akesuensis]